MNPVKIKYRRLYAALIFIIVACNDNNINKTNPVPADAAKKITATANIDNRPDSTVETKKDFLDTLTELSFVKESNRYIDSFSNHKHSISYMIDTADKEYNVTAGYNGEERFETYYIFTVNKKTRQIKVMDVVSGDMVTPEAFEKLLRTKQIAAQK